MNLDLSGKRALVCGGSKGLGFAAAKELALLGAEIILLARSEDLLQKNIDIINQIKKGDHRYLLCDLMDVEGTNQQINKLIDQNPIHILINNSGGPPGGNIENATMEQFLTAFNNHLIANHNLSQLLIPGMKQSGYGRIINIVSTSVRQPIKGLGVSNTIRGSVASWAKTLSTELAESGVTVNNVLPGTTKTERLDDILKSRERIFNFSPQEAIDSMLTEIPMNRFAEPEEIASVIAFIASPAAAYITGTSIPVDGGKIKSI